MDISDHSEIDDEPAFQRKIYNGQDHPDLPEAEQLEIDKSFSYQHLNDVLDIYHDIQEIIHANSKRLYFLDKLSPGDLYHISLQLSMITVDVPTSNKNTDTDYQSEEEDDSSM